MSIFEMIKGLNKHVNIFHISDQAFTPYGKKITNYDFTEMIHYMEETEIPAAENIYVPSVEHMEKIVVAQMVQKNHYGDMEIQVGYCNGRNSHLNGLEYHKGSEINVAATDMVLLLGNVQEIKKNRYDVKKIEGFFVPMGSAIELYQTTLHFAPCKVLDSGFKCIVILPRGTNTPLDKPIQKLTEEDELLFMRNKWLLAHPERKPLVEKGAYPGITGENIEIHFS
ncbi:DUF4867 family protein [Fodinisporobacter ferrooxydans]|uniref:DUF4867 family protein n=1 Tax=Fodinisporobacter ferrooxydans TaxID=2901836 RepID=A0ABY4CEX5_9BACL|nr:DUF4867 family protein [Alicyclobacillaceae bacterium MYW30-H2]